MFTSVNRARPKSPPDNQSERESILFPGSHHQGGNAHGAGGVCTPITQIKFAKRRKSTCQVDIASGEIAKPRYCINEPVAHLMDTGTHHAYSKWNSSSDNALNRVSLSFLALL